MGAEIDIVEKWVNSEVPSGTNIYQQDGSVFVEDSSHGITVKVTYYSGRGMLKVERVDAGYDAWCAYQKDDLLDLVTEFLKP